LNDNTLTDFFSINFSVFGPGTSASELNGLIDLAISNGKWGMREVHGVNDNSWASVPLADYIAHCNYIKSKMKSGDLWNATATQVTTYLMQTQNYIPTTTYDAANQVITVTFNNPGIDVSDLRSDVTLNVNLGGLTGFVYAYQGSTKLPVVNHGSYVSANCFPHKGTIKLYKNDPIVVDPGDFTTYQNMVKKGQQGVVFTVPDMPNYTFIWTYSGTGATFNSSGNSVVINFSPTATSGTLSVKASNPNGVSNARTIDITVLDVADVSRCGSGSVTMTINGPAGTYEWYNSPTGGTLLKSGSSYTTSLTQTDTFYIDKAIASTTAVTGRSTMGSQWGAPVAGYAQKFTVYRTITLNSIGIAIPGWTSGNVYFVLLGSDGSTVVKQSSAVAVAAGSNKTITLNFTIAPGTYYLAARGTITDIEMASPNTSNYVIPNVIELDGNPYSGTNYAQVDDGDFGYAINWNITYQPASNLTRVPVIAAINSAASAPGNFIQKVNPVCGGQSNVVYAVPDVAGTSFDWNYTGTGFTIAGGQGTHSITTNWASNATNGTLKVTATNSCGTSSPTTLPITINAVPAQPSAVSGNNAVCNLISQNYSVISIAGVNYSWSVNPSSAATITGSGNSVSVSWSASGILSCTPSNACGNGTPSTLAVTVTSVPSKPSAISGINTVCASSATQTYTVNSVVGVNYNWSVSPTSAATITGSANAASVAVVWNTSGTIICTPSNGCGSGTPSSLSVTVKDVPAKPSSIAGNTTLCVSEATQTYSITPITGVNYTWSVTPSTAASITGSANAASVTVVWNTSGTIQCTPSNSCGNGTPSTLTVTVNDVPLKPSSISGSNTVCASAATQTYSITPVTGVNYSWSISPLSAATFTGSSTTASVTVVWNTSGTIICTPSNSCGSGTTSSLPVTVTDVPSKPSSISGSNTVCASAATQTYSVTPITGVNYSWSVNPVSAATISGSSTTASVTVVWNTSGTITCTPSNGCGNGSASSLSVTVNDVPVKPSGISGSNTVCASAATQTYSITPITGVTYSWSISPTSAATITGSSTTASITVVWNTSGTIICTPSNSCGSGTASSLSVTVNDVPSKPSSITGSNTLCAASATQTYSVTTVSGVNYNWNVSPSSSATITGSGNTVSVVWNSSGTIQCTPSNGCGSGTPSTLSVSVTDVPSKPSSIIGSNSVCASSGIQNYNVTSTSGVNYTWSVSPSTAATISGSGNAVSVSWNSSGTLSCVPSNGCGAGTPSSLSVTVNDIPAKPSSIAGAGTLCASATTQTYSITPITGVSYNWSVNPSSAATITGAGNAASITVDWNTSGTLLCTPSNSCGSGTPSLLSVSIMDVPSQPVIAGNSTVCASVATQTYSVNASSGVTYSWSVNPSNAATISGSGNSVSVTWNSSGTLSCTPSNTCGIGATATLSVSVIDVPSKPAYITGSNNVCASVSQDYSITSVAGATYSWSVNPSASATITGSGNNVSVVWNATGTLLCTLSNSCGNGTSSMLAVTVNNVPSKPSSITGNNTLCATDAAQTYSITPVTGVNYHWSMTPTSADTITGSANAASVTVAWNVSGTIICTPSNSCGSGSPSTLSVTVNDVPSQPANFTLYSSLVTKGTSGVIYSVPAENGNAYIWSYSGNGVAIHNSGNTINMDFSDTATSGTLTVVAYNECGTSALSRDLVIQVQTATQGDFVQFTNPVSQGQTGVVYSIPPQNGVSYNWTFTGTGWTINGTGNAVTVDFSPTATSGKLIVIENDGNGHSAVKELFITVLPVTAVNAPEEIQRVFVYPNPFEFTSMIEVTIEGDEELSIEIMNSLGEKVKQLVNREQLSQGTHQFIVDDLSPGAYIVKIKIGDREKHVKIIKN